MMPRTTDEYAEVKIPYGKTYLSGRIPSSALLYKAEPKMTEGIANLSTKIAEAIRHPIGGGSLDQTVNKKEKILILVDDNTRVTPVHKILPVVLDELNHIGVDDSRISVMVATGTHRPMTRQELDEKLGKALQTRIEVLQHQYEDHDSLARIEDTESGAPVSVNRKVLECGTLIGIGNIIPHCDAGFSGGAKIVQPGICGYETTAYTHVLAGLQEEIPLGDVGTPCRIEAEAVAQQVGLKLIINVVLNPENEVVKVVAGDPVQAHRAGVHASRQVYETLIPGRADIVIVSSYPADIDYWQAMKGLCSAHFGVKRGGTIIFVTPCPEGVSEAHPKFMEYWARMSNQEVSRRVKELSFANEELDMIASENALMTSKIRERSDILLVSEGISSEESKTLGFEKVPVLQDAIDYALKRHSTGSIGVITHGGDLLVKEVQ